MSGSANEFADFSVGDYRLEKEIARGASGIVYRAWHTKLEREVAIKILRKALWMDDSAKSRFRMEASMAASIVHPGIARIYEAGEDHDVFYIAMELVDGPNLAETASEGPLPALTAARYTKDASEAIHSAHQAGVIHRDLKPSNAIVGPDGKIRLVDFGIARRDGGDGLTLTGEVMGTPGYMAPEQAMGKTSSPQTDVYGLGALLYHLLTGRAPFTGENHAVILKQIAQADPVAPSLLNPAVPRDLETVCLKALSHDPSQRYADASQVADELGRFLRGESVLARRPASLEIAWRWCRKHPALAASLTAIVILITGFLVTSAISTAKIRGLQDEAMMRLYSSDIRMALLCLSDGRFGAAAELLNRHIPKDGEKDLRNFEWYHSKSLCNQREDNAFVGSRGHVDSLDVSSDNQYIAAGADNFCLWRVSDQQRLSEHTGTSPVHSLAFSPDSQSVAIGYIDGSIQIRNVPDGIAMHSATCNERNPVVQWAADETGSYLVVVTSNQHWRWRYQDNQQGLDSQAAYAGSSWRPYISETAKVASYTRPPKWDHTLLDLTNGQVLGDIPSTNDFVRTSAYSEAQQMVVLGHYSGKLSLIKKPFTSPVMLITAFNRMVDVLQFSSDGYMFASASGEIIRVWHISDPSAQHTLLGHRHRIRSLAFSPDGSYLVSGDVNNHVLFWDLTKRSSEQEAFEVTHLGSQDGSTILRRRDSEKLEVIYWPNQKSEIAIPFPAALESLHPVRAIWNKGFMSGWVDADMHLFDSGKTDSPLPKGAKVDNCSSDGRWIYFTRPPANTPAIWDVKNNKVVVELPLDPPNPSRVIFSPDNRYAAAGYRSGDIHVYDLLSGERVQQFRGHERWVYASSFSTDGTLLATGGLDGKVCLWDWRSARLLKTFHSSLDSYWSVALSPDGSRLAAGTGESSVVFWDVKTGLECGVFSIDVQPRTVEHLFFTSDGKALCAAGRLLLAEPVTEESN